MPGIYSQDIDLILLRKQLATFFSNDELNTLCFDLKVDFDDIPGETRESKARELVKFCYRKGLLIRLIELCKESRPQVSWTHDIDTLDKQTHNAEADQPLLAYYQLVREFNRNRHLPYTDQRTRQGDDIAFQLRELAPTVFEKLDVNAWLNSKSIGKRIGAVEYLNWIQDIEYFDDLVERLSIEIPFMQFHILLALNNMIDQLDEKQQSYLSTKLNEYDPKEGGSRLYWKQRILAEIENSN